MNLIKNREILRWLWTTSRGMRKQALLNMLIGVVDVSCGLLFVWTCKHAIDIATGDAMGSLFHTAIGIALLLLAQLLIGAGDRWVSSLLGVRAQNTLRRTMFAHLMQSEWRGREKHHTGDVVNRLELDVNYIVSLLTDVLPNVVVVALQFIGSFIFLFCMDKTLAVVSVLIMPLFALLSKVYVKRMRKMNREVRESDSKIQSVMQENLQHKMIIKTLEQNNAVEERLGDVQQQLHSQIIRRTRFNIFSFFMVRSGFSIGYLVAFLWGVTGIAAGTVTYGVMTAFLQLVGQIQRPIMDMARMIPGLVSALTSAERLMDLENLPLEEKGEQQWLHSTAGVRFQDVSFSYCDGDRKVFDGFTYDFPPRSSTAVLGETGAGKTTLVRLMLSLVKPVAGEVVLYNKEKEQFAASPLTRCNFVYVPQGNTLFSGTVRDNLLLGNPNATEEQMRRALHIACADFVQNLPGGLDALCGELGGGLSEGQAQRIAIARSLLRPGSIFLFDEVTSALDKETERELIKRLTDEMGEKTLVFISHRQAIVEHCTQVLHIGPMA